MSAGRKLLGFMIGLVVLVGAAAAVGNAVGPIGGPVHDPSTADHEGGAHAGAAAARDDEPQPAVPKGLVVSQDGYTLRLAETELPAGSDVTVAFQILGPQGSPVTDFDVVHEEDLHLIAVRRDFSGFQHVHPEMSSEGAWSSSLDLTPGLWRLFADFQAAGADALTLGADLGVAGDFQPEPPADETRTAAVDGYRVSLAGDLTAGAEAELAVTVTRDGEPVTDLEPYLGSYGHLVALREGDLAYLHVHPEGEPDDGTTQPGPEVVFYAEVPSADGYRLFLDFKHAGVVRTAAFAVPGSSAERDDESDDHGDHDQPGDQRHHAPGHRT